MRHPTEYDEDREFDWYIRSNLDSFRTPFELRAIRLGVMYWKAKIRIAESECPPPAWATKLPLAKSEGPPPAWTTKLLREYEEQVDDAVRDAIGADLDGFAKFQQQVRGRIEAAFASGELHPNRCPACERIVVSPKARQCLWCRHDWHGIQQ